jgi:hypothetical protein
MVAMITLKRGTGRAEELKVLLLKWGLSLHCCIFLTAQMHVIGLQGHL